MYEVKAEMENSIGFVILTWNSEKYISECLNSLIALCENGISVTPIVIDNGSCDSTVQRVSQIFNTKNRFVDFKLFQLEKNYGTTVSRNMGIRYLLECQNRPNYICILDSDTVVNELAMNNLISVLKSDPSCGIVGPRMHDANMVYQRSGRQIPTLTEKLLKVLPVKSLQEKGTAQEASIPEDGTGSIDVGYLMSACWMMRPDLFTQIGMLDEKIYYAPEDVDFCIRVWKAGLRVQYCYDADILHHWQRLSRKKLFSKHNFEHLKGLAYLFWKHKYLFHTNTIQHK